MTDDDARGRQNFTLRGRELSIAPADICTATRDVPPTTSIDGRYKYFVELHGRRFPIKQVLRLVMSRLVMSRPWGFGAKDAHPVSTSSRTTDRDAGGAALAEAARPLGVIEPRCSRYGNG